MVAWRRYFRIVCRLLCCLLYCNRPVKLYYSIIVIQLMFLGINVFLALLRTHFNWPRHARAKMSLSRAKNIFSYAREHQLYCSYNKRHMYVHNTGQFEWFQGVTASPYANWLGTGECFSECFAIACFAIANHAWRGGRLLKLNVIENWKFASRCQIASGLYGP